MQFRMLLFGLFAFLLTPRVWAQSTTSNLILEDLTKKSESQLKKQLPQEIDALESKLEPELYQVGPGDLFLINIWGANSNEFETRITPEQKLILPGVGEIDLAHYSLQQAKTAIQDFVLKRYLNTQVSVALIGIRKFRVHVTGAVNQPGSVIVNANTRVSDVIEAAGGFKETINVRALREETYLEMPTRSEATSRTTNVRKDETQVDLPASKRNIQLLRHDGQKLNVDLLKFMQGGDASDNPYLLDGDVVFVPTKQFEVGQVAIWGAVRYPGEFEYAPNDNLGNLLILAHGFTLDADKSQLEIIRFLPDHQTTQAIPIPLEGPAVVDPSKVPLQADDRVFVRYLPQFHRKAQVVVRGEVKFPGGYNIIEGQTTLREIIQQAGGATSKASLSEASLVRKAMEDIEDPEFKRLQLMTVDEMTEQEREYFKIKSREKVGALAVDFTRLILMNDSSMDVPLLDRDEIIIPSISRTISVSGQVVRAGLITFVPGKTLAYYIQKTGGYGWNARKSGIRLIRGQTGEWLRPNKNTEIFLGDKIFVPEQPERDYWILFKDFMQLAYQIATIWLVINQTTK
ncbi:SLBB domain-containing protein [candidate division KSB1 bacterium]|nr:SLBB domain-containing protein [candidate division KSB1 bacterium]